MPATPKNAIRALKNAQNVAGYLEYNPGPGIYSRLERAVQQLPENVRVQELPGLLKRHKDGIPGWELKAVDLDSVVAGRTVVPRDELLAAVRERSPMFTHREIVLTDEGPRGWRQTRPSMIGKGTKHGRPQFSEHAPGIDQNIELLLTQPTGASRVDEQGRTVYELPQFYNHWGDVDVNGAGNAVAHVRAGRAGDALRIQEIQSDLANHNIKALKALDRRHPKGDEDYPIPFPLEDSYRELLVKRMLLHAAQNGYNAIEVANPATISRSVGQGVDNAEHLYGKVIPGDVERLGRKMGGLTEEAPKTPLGGVRQIIAPNNWDTPRSYTEAIRLLDDEFYDSLPLGTHWSAKHALGVANAAARNDPKLLGYAKEFFDSLQYHEGMSRDDAAQFMQKFMGGLGDYTAKIAEIKHAYRDVPPHNVLGASSEVPAGRRYIISDEMRRNIITKGIPASVAVGAATGLAGGEAEAAPRLPESQLFLRASMPWQTQRKIARLTKQVDAAYESGDFKTAEKLDAQREQLLENWDNQFEGLDEGDGNVDFEDDDPNENPNEDLEPSGVDYTREQSWTMQLGDRYGAIMAGLQGRGPVQGIEGSPAEIADALRGVFPDTEMAKQIPDGELIAYAKQAFDEREALKARLREGEPGAAIRALRQRGVPMAAAGAAVLAGQNSRADDPQQIVDSLRSVQAAKFQPEEFADLEQRYREWQSDKAMHSGVAEQHQPVKDNGFDWSMAISPAERAAYHESLAASGPNPDHDKFRSNVDAVLDQPLIRVAAMRDPEIGRMAAPDSLADDARITPRQWIENWGWQRGYAKGDSYQQLINDVIANIKGDIPGEAPETVVRATNSLLGAMQASSPGGRYAKAEPISEGQLADWQRQYGDQANWMLSPGSAEDFQAQAGYELLRTMQDGEHAPAYANTLSVATNFLAGGGTARADQLYTGHAIPARAREANRLVEARAAQPADRPPAFRDAQGNFLYSDYDTRSLGGLMKAGGDTSSWQGKVSMPLYRAFSEWNRNPIGQLTGDTFTQDAADRWNATHPLDVVSRLGIAMEPWNTTMDRDRHIERTQPILKAGMSPEEFRNQVALNREDTAKREDYESSYYPNLQTWWDSATMQKTPRTWGNPLYESVVKFPRQTLESPLTAGIAVTSAGVGAVGGGLLGAAEKGIRGLARGTATGLAKGARYGVASQVADLPADFAQDQAVSGAILGPNWLNAMTTPYDSNELMGDVQPDDPDLDRKREEMERRRQTKWFQGMQSWNRSEK